MCPSDSEPLFHCRRWDSLYDNEAGSDVKFIVGPEQWLVPGHRSVLAKANPVFKAMLEGAFARPASEHIPIQDVDGRAFANLLRFLYGGEVHLQSVTTARLTLQAAYKYLCADLVTVCITYLDDNIQIPTVLEIYSSITPYTQRCWAPSAPPLFEPPYPPAAPAPDPEVMPSCDKLLHNCFNFIDRHADEVLMQEDIEELDAEGLELILSRDTLGVTSENFVFEALNRWCNCECKRRHFELTEENRRRVLGEDSLFLVRYLLMRSEDFLAGPMQSGWLDQKDSAVIMGHILNHSTDTKTKRLEDVWPTMKRPRMRTDVGYFPLSSRSGRFINNDAEVKDGGKEKGKCRKGKCGRSETKKDKKRKNSSSPSPDRDKRSTGSKVLECLCGAIACIFD